MPRANSSSGSFSANSASRPVNQTEMKHMPRQMLQYKLRENTTPVILLTNRK